MKTTTIKQFENLFANPCYPEDFKGHIPVILTQYYCNDMTCECKKWGRLVREQTQTIY